MPNELVGHIEASPEVRVELVGSGPPGPPGDTPYIGANGDWWIGGTDTGVPATGGGAAKDHAFLTGREKENQHPVDAIAGLREALDEIPDPMTADELRKILFDGGMGHAR